MGRGDGPAQVAVHTQRFNVCPSGARTHKRRGAGCYPAEDALLVVSVLRFMSAW